MKSGYACNLYLVVGMNDCVLTPGTFHIAVEPTVTVGLWNFEFPDLRAVEKAYVAVALSNIKFVAFAAPSIGQATCIVPPAV